MLMLVLSKVAAPAVWLLNASTRLIFSLFGSSSGEDTTVTEEEIKMLVGEAESAALSERAHHEQSRQVAIAIGSNTGKAMVRNGIVC